jgi:hypothetical protein
VRATILPAAYRLEPVAVGRWHWVWHPSRLSGLVTTVDGPVVRDVVAALCTSAHREVTNDGRLREQLREAAAALR